MKKLKQLTAGTDSLRWRINPGFDDYVRNRTGDGTVTLSAGATRDDEGYYSFSRAVSLGDDKNLQFDGSVEFRAYLGVLSLRIADPSLHIAADMVHMYIADDSAPAGTRLELATAAIEPGATGSIQLDPRLTERGAELFLGQYPAGTSLAPLNIVLDVPASSAFAVEGVS